MVGQFDTRDKSLLGIEKVYIHAFYILLISKFFFLCFDKYEFE